jgi:hypothetical protein
MHETYSVMTAATAKFIDYLLAEASSFPAELMR